MDREQSTLSTPAPNKHTTAHAQLWIGDNETLHDTVHAHLQKTFCSSDGCNTCTTCMQIRAEQYHAIHWFCPEKYYTLDSLETLFATIKLQLDPGESHFFVLKHADYLGTSCANALLKSIEEPPQGYHFILLAQRLEQILPTIRSRCTLTTYQHQHSDPAHHALFDHLISSLQRNPASFLKELDKSKINDRESFELADGLLKHWMRRLEKAVRENEKTEQTKALRMTTVLEKLLAHPPMPGSSKVFLKNLYLQIHEA